MSASPPRLQPQPGQTLTVSGDLASGEQIPIDWAARGQVACFPQTRFYEFQGNHVHYVVDMPGNTVLEIGLRPDASTGRINLYALRFGAGREQLPPVDSCSSAESSYPLYAGSPGREGPDRSRRVQFLSVRHPYTIVVGVAGARDVQHGSFQLSLSVKSRT